jgi:hypothetical protein
VYIGIKGDVDKLGDKYSLIALLFFGINLCLMLVIQIDPKRKIELG